MGVTQSDICYKQIDKGSDKYMVIDPVIGVLVLPATQVVVYLNRLVGDTFASKKIKDDWWGPDI